MRGELLRLKEYAAGHGLCGRYREMWDAAADGRMLADMALDANGALFIGEAFASGWLTEELVCGQFGRFVNGGYVRRGDGYTSALWCGEKDIRLVLEETQTCVACCTGVVRVPAGRVRRLLVTGGSHLKVRCEGRLDLVLFGDVRADVEKVGDGRCRMRRHEGRFFAY